MSEATPEMIEWLESHAGQTSYVQGLLAFQEQFDLMIEGKGEPPKGQRVAGYEDMVLARLERAAKKETDDEQNL